MTEFFIENWTVIKSAPLPFVIIFFVAFPIAYFFFKDRIEGHKDIQETLKSKLKHTSEELTVSQQKCEELQAQVLKLQKQNKQAALEQEKLEKENLDMKVKYVYPRLFPSNKH